MGKKKGPDAHPAIRGAAHQHLDADQEHLGDKLPGCERRDPHHTWERAQLNQGRGTWAYDRDTLGTNDLPLLDPFGNFFVQTNATGGQDGGYTQVLRWNAGTIPDHPGQTLLDIFVD